MINELRNSANDVMAMIDGNQDLSDLRSNDALLDSQVRSLISSMMHIFNRCNTANANGVQDADALYFMIKIQEAEQLLTVISNYQAPQGLLQKFTNFSNWIKTTLSPTLSSMGSKILAIVTSMITPTGWTLKGKVGVGLTCLVDMEIEVRFGK